MNITIIGAGRAGHSFALALTRVGHTVTVLHHDDTVANGAEVVLLCVPDGAIAEVAANLTVDEGTVVLHCAGSRTLAELAPHVRRGSLHPLVPLPDPETGASRLAGAVFCVQGDQVASTLALSLGGRPFSIDDSQRAAYHATACVAANHLVALMGQVERLANGIGLELADFVGLAQAALDDVNRVGPAAALTGPAARGDVTTIDAHLRAIDPDERDTYVALVRAALALAESRALARA